VLRRRKLLMNSISSERGSKQSIFKTN
jgi:hypothetical protein